MWGNGRRLAFLRMPDSSDLPPPPSAAVPVDATVTLWLERLREDDERPASELWSRYFRRLVSLAERHLPKQARRAFDEEDVALSAFHSLCEGVRRGRFPELGDRDELWALLTVITARKARDRMKGESAAKRGGGRAPVPAELVDILGAEPTPAFAAELADESERLLERLEDDALRTIALRRLEGYENTEIARELGCAVRTVERRLALIRQTWEQAGA